MFEAKQGTEQEVVSNGSFNLEANKLRETYGQ
jgi:hypothetical protein